ncbi:acetylornithine deacetylase/succinyldiaminopimelate desuccinylase-like deacylase [Mycolicibacterium conceptionense]|uniref:Acetylornithine deacetylase/succinyldiaminopimelate desuccinylase-like deacylase n=1 Tax=Mycolicibacterium conceptionense TaxID=451644 RepID=A0A0U1DPX7_9MYCO|nr:acetylornithine deacetylase/succinyldiaminopimelate desuccinylase-like deacylase [Mycolicibacterium conceptionense]
MVPMDSVTVPASSADEVVELVSALIRFDTSNTGDPATTKGEAECAHWVAQQLQEVGYQTEYVEAGAPGRGNVFARLPGADAAGAR